ncbi:nitrogen fixation protein NifQ [Rhizobium sullae]|uniref:Nitrogen fixation protein NifQ n=1 Tax=Rhizobium sullae TaxID=50338 RepID=A0A4R3PQP5_RHISU|nr:nitrogen fixation protein NifQ [Rhizobium sullae]TCU04031.1 nitrogen fixation protein NifQ [Rhizobium sullae]UWU19389.1 nitrogen fixation protein NifQ [Rhizobium sullae]
MSSVTQIRNLSNRSVTLLTDRPGLPQSSQSVDLKQPIDLDMDFDQYVFSCVLLHVLEEIAADVATATEATGLSRAELRDILNRCVPATVMQAFGLENVREAEPGVEEELLRDLLLAHARHGDPASACFAKIIARRALRHDHLWLELGLSDRSELSLLLAIHFPTLAAGNTNHMRWKKYLYRMLCEAEGSSMCTAPSCRECKEYQSCFVPEKSEPPG